MVVSSSRFIITGASEGIGRELAVQLAREGAKLALAARSADKLEAVCGECETAGGSAIAIPADVGVEADCKRVVEQAVAFLGGIDVLVTNAGISHMKRLVDSPDTLAHEKVMAVNYLGA